MKISDALDKAVSAHAKWKYHLMDAIDTGKSAWRVGDVRSDHACDFGKWLIALPLSDRLSEHAKKVRTLHAEFHGLAADVLEMALAGRKEEARARGSPPGRSVRPAEPRNRVSPVNRTAGASSFQQMPPGVWPGVSMTRQ